MYLVYNTIIYEILINLQKNLLKFLFSMMVKCYMVFIGILGD